MSAMLEADVVVIGAGPAGLAAAKTLSDAGVGRVLVIDRDDAAGGLPRYCGHPGFGWAYSRRLESGPAFARRCLAALDPAVCRVLTRTTALALHPGPVVEIVGPETGLAALRPRAAVLATGVRERPRGARLVPGARPERGVLTTGQLQQMVARGVAFTGRRAVVVGSEHVSFSALLTARRAGLRVVAMVEPGERVLSFRGAAALTRWLTGMPIHLHSRVVDILGAGDSGQVKGVTVSGPDDVHEIACDHVIFSGDFVPDAILAQNSGLDIDPATKGPAIDQFMRTSEPGVFAAGNILRPVESSGVAALEGARAGAAAAAFVTGRLDAERAATPIALDPRFRYIVPQRWAWNMGDMALDPPLRPSLRVRSDVGRGRIRVRVGDSAVWWGRRKPLLRERRLRVDLASLPSAGATGDAISLDIV